jgi:hypothetical protein
LIVVFIGVCGPCLNGGQCNQFGLCICPPQWNGSSCDRTYHFELLLIFLSQNSPDKIFPLSEDVDECTLGRNDCDPLVECVNFPGGYNCTPCPPGYIDIYGNGTFCQGVVSYHLLLSSTMKY